MRAAKSTAWAIACAFAFACATAPGPAAAYCPSYTPAGTQGSAKCGVEPALGTNLAPSAWNTIFAKVAGGKATWGAAGPDIGKLSSGCLKPRPPSVVDARFPCHVLKALAMQESGWVQFCVPDTPASSVGAPSRTVVSFDCGYGIGQVTSGMHVGEAPDFDRARVAAEPTYNLATGTRILREKWAATSCVGDGNPDVVEDWYSALWAYNGLSYSNNPNNPNLKANRGPYNPKNGGAYAYQERVMGWMEFPPSAAHWPPLAPAYPDRGAIGGAKGPATLEEPSCASPTSCATTRPTHASACDAVVPRGGDAGDVNVGFPLPPGVVPLPAVTDGPGDGGRPGATIVDLAPPDDGCGCRAAGTRSRTPGGSAAALTVAVACFVVRRLRRARGGARRQTR